MKLILALLALILLFPALHAQDTSVDRLTNPVEMASDMPLVVAILKGMPEYLERFKQALPNDPDAITFNNVVAGILLSLVAAGYWKWSGSK